jgi:hypothetical protein
VERAVNDITTNAALPVLGPLGAAEALVASASGMEEDPDVSTSREVMLQDLAALQAAIASA